MISGMTGFGTSAFLYKGKSYTVNIRSVNHKFLDYVINLPDGIASLEAKIKKELSKFLKRGRITLAISSNDLPEHQLVLNEKLLFQYYNALKQISRKLNIKQNIFVHDLIGLPEVINFKKIDVCSNENFLHSLDKSLKKALRGLVSLRRQEGRSIHKDICSSTDKINIKLQSIKNRLKGLIEQQKKILVNDALQEFLKNYNCEEEISRMEFHIKTFRSQINQSGALGKMLDFITQEMQREINTLSAKIRDEQISYSSIIIKDEIEKMREQLQNVE